MGDPYRPAAASQTSNFPFASRTSTQQAPLFHSAADGFPEEEEETEHDREVADFYALQKSRRHFDGGYLKDSSEIEQDGQHSSYDEHQSPLYDDRSGKGKGIRSSWRGGKANRGERSFVDDPAGAESQTGMHASRSSSRARGRLVDVGLGDSLRSEEDAQRSGSFEAGDDDPPSIQQFRERPQPRDSHIGAGPFPMPAETDHQAQWDHPHPRNSTDSSPSSIAQTRVESPAHDAFWGRLFLISIACLLATAFLVYLHTSSPSGDKSRWGDTVYMTVHRSFFLLGIYTLVSVFISLLWIAVLRSYVRPLVYVVIIAVPVILYSFSLYPFVSSFRGAWRGASVQDKVMRFGSVIPFIMASMWVYNIIRSRHAIGKAVSVLEFACRILAANVELLAFGLGVLACIVSWTWVWMLMFSRVFLGGHISRVSLFVIDISSWWLGVYFILVYLWSLGVIAGVQRTITAATVSQWYFHRFATHAPTSRQIVQAAAAHSATTLFGTICLSSLLALLIRLPLILLPRRLVSIFSLFAYSLVPSPITTLTNPLTLTYAAIYSQPLAVSARGLSQMTILSPSAAKSSLHPRWFSWPGRNSPSLLSYRLSKLILHAVRFIMSLALGFGGWVASARSLNTPDANGTTKGSLYAYVIGLIAGTIGWSVLGSMESVVADIVDASVICWSSEVGTYGTEARYCREAGWLFGDDVYRDTPSAGD
ncbi:hypothetical protein PHISP_03707 [Aspergillus sp. HF37]|nr:hypothetical protein PHISP_03707 [Aspergillus sp. HF37]